MLVVFANMIITSCNDNDDNIPSSSPGLLTATGETSFTGYTLSGILRLTVSTENPEAMPNPEAFYYNCPDSGGNADNNHKGTLSKFTVSTVERVDNGQYMLYIDYAFKPSEKIDARIELKYEGTSTAIPLSIKALDAVTTDKTYFGAGVTGRLSFVPQNADIKLPEDLFADMTGSIFKASGEHAETVKFEVDNENRCIDITISENFEFSPAEEKAGEVRIPVTSKVLYKNAYMSFEDTLVLCPTRIAEEVTTSGGEITWILQGEAEALGMDTDSDGAIYFKDRNNTYYFARKGETLVNPQKYSPKVFPAIGNYFNDGNLPKPTIKLLSTTKLEPGEYILIARMKKLRNDPKDNRYVDIRMPFVKE